MEDLLQQDHINANVHSMLDLNSANEPSNKNIQLSSESILAEVANKEKAKKSFKYGYSDQIIDVNKMFEVSINQVDGILN